MPAFPSRANLLATGLNQASGAPEVSEPAGDAKIGAQLMGPTGFTCISCHGQADAKPIAVFEGQGINFSYVHQRLNPEFLHRWMHHPQRIDPTSIMPKYTSDDGESVLSDVLDGDFHQQVEAMRAHFKAIASDRAVKE